jgi:hypothetical protein
MGTGLKFKCVVKSAWGVHDEAEFFLYDLMTSFKRICPSSLRLEGKRGSFWGVKPTAYLQTDVRLRKLSAVQLLLPLKTSLRGQEKFILYSWINIDQLDVSGFIIQPFTAKPVLNVITLSNFRSLRLTMDLFHVMYFSVGIEVLTLEFLFSSECLVVMCVIVLISLFL